jgi:uncharacterized membrane protein YedE/YeeE
MIHLTSISAAFGGALIGLSAALLWLGLGRIAGISGIAGSFVSDSQARLRGRLFAGAVLFGIGWGLVGFCPGPALASLTIDGASPLMFVAAMLADMAGFGTADRLIAARFRPA